MGGLKGEIEASYEFIDMLWLSGCDVIGFFFLFTHCDLTSQAIEGNYARATNPLSTSHSILQLNA